MEKKMKQLWFIIFQDFFQLSFRDVPVLVESSGCVFVACKYTQKWKLCKLREITGHAAIKNARNNVKYEPENAK